MDNFALILSIIGALNWGVAGLFGADLIGVLCGGSQSMLSRFLYTIIALGGLWAIGLLFKDKLPQYDDRTARRE